MLPEFLFCLPQGDIAYDIETYPNVFTFRCRHVDLDRRWSFEISPRRNDLDLLVSFIRFCQMNGNRWVGFNNIGFDYPVVHWVYQNQKANPRAADIYAKAMSIINAHPNAKFAHMVWESDWLVPQIDLYKIHHFDNKARATSLKVLEFNMRMSNIEDLPFDVGTELTNSQIEVLCQYNDHDVDATVDFYHESKEQIKFREELTAKYDKNFLNHNDTKIGKDYFIMELEKASPGCCYRYVDGKRQMVQTIRDQINLADIILPCVRFSDPEFNRILSWFKSQVITETKGVFKDISCSVNGFEFDFGTGGIHGSISSELVRSSETHIIIDADVKSYYPNLAIANKLYPAHLGETFCDIYEELYNQRAATVKGSAENAMLKLALNGVYGDSNNKYSPFYDPQYTMSITINGQLLLCMLAEWLMKTPGLRMLSINTDGLCCLVPRQYEKYFYEVCAYWDQYTGLTLEYEKYKMMAIADVNNYLGVVDEEEN